MVIYIMNNRFVLIIMTFIFFICCSSDKNDQQIENKLEIIASTTELEVGKEIILKIAGASIDNIANVSWDMGDTNKNNGIEISHIYSFPGNFQVVATIIYSNGETNKLSINIYSFYQNVNEVIRKSLKQRFTEKEVLICGHRGFGKFSAENSLASFKLAIEKNIDMIEIDIRSSKDGKLVLMHDQSINRTTNGEGNVSQLNYTELSSYFLYDGGTLTTEKIPLLSEALEEARGKLYIDIDVKSSNFRETYEIIKMYGMLNQVLFTVYDIQTNKQLQNLDKNILIMPVIYEMKDLTDYLVINSPLHIAQFNSKGFTDEIVKKATEENVAIFKNTYVNTSNTPTSDNYKEVNEFIEKKGKVIQTDHPEELKTYFNSL